MSAFGGGEWKGDRSGSSADGIVLARKRNVGNMEDSDRRPTVPVFRLTNVGGIAQEGPTVAQDVSSKNGEGAPRGCSSSPASFTMNEKKILQKFPMVEISEH